MQRKPLFVSRSGPVDVLCFISEQLCDIIIQDHLYSSYCVDEVFDVTFRWLQDDCNICIYWFISHGYRFFV
ncbi:MAG: hypothetical protein LBK67_13145 [Coriobacteriales bacterium]|nr:hypothetical protein [Coriobacteriales bacterium]